MPFCDIMKYIFDISIETNHGIQRDNARLMKMFYCTSELLRQRFMHTGGRTDADAAAYQEVQLSLDRI